MRPPPAEGELAPKHSEQRRRNERNNRRKPGRKIGFPVEMEKANEPEEPPVSEAMIRNQDEKMYQQQTAGNERKEANDRRHANHGQIFARRRFVFPWPHEVSYHRLATTSSKATVLFFAAAIPGPIPSSSVRD